MQLSTQWSAIMGDLKKGQDFLDSIIAKGKYLKPQAIKASKNILPTVSLVTNAVKSFSKTKIEIRFDEFRDEIMFSEFGKNEWRSFKDEDYTKLRIKLESLGIPKVGRELVRDVVSLVAKENSFDSAKEWLENIVPKWDGTLRIESFFKKYFGAEDTEYTSSVSKYLWSALAGRILVPGIKADMVPILYGEQGCGKSTGVAAICPHTDFFTEISFNEKDDDLSRKMRGHLIAEIGELRGLNTKDVETIKAFVTRTHEHWIPKFKEYSTSYARRTAFIGTTNQEQFLADQTGNRRWLPLTVGRVDVDSIRNDRMQLWAEARDTYKGILWQDAERLSKEKHGKHMIVDPWQEIIYEWLTENSLFPVYGTDINYDSYVTTKQVLHDAIRMEPKMVNKSFEMRAAGVLKNLGFVKTSKRISGRPTNIYVHKDLDTTVSTSSTPENEEEYPF